MAVFDDTAPWEDKLLLYPHSIDWQKNIPIAHKAKATTITVEQDEPLRAECAHFLECMATRHTPRTDGEEGLRVLKVLNACQESLEQEKSVSFSVQRHRQKQDLIILTQLPLLIRTSILVKKQKSGIFPISCLIAGLEQSVTSARMW